MTDDRITGAEAQALLDETGFDYPANALAARLDLEAAAPRLARTVVALEEELRQAREALNACGLARMPADCAPLAEPVLVAGGIAMRTAGGEWLSGMCEPPFSRKLQWTPEWWAPTPHQNDAPTGAETAARLAAAHADARVREERERRERVENAVRMAACNESAACQKRIAAAIREGRDGE